MTIQPSAPPSHSNYLRHGRTTAINDHSDLQVLQRIKRYLLPKDFTISPDLLEEINNLVEYPTAFYGKYNPTYLEIPEEILITSMRDHQRYVITLHF